MDWGTIIAAAVTAVGALIGTYMSNRRQTDLMDYRLKELEKKVGQHNNLEGRVIVIETKLKDHNIA